MTIDHLNQSPSYNNNKMNEAKKFKKELVERPLLKQIEIQNLKMKIIENYERKQWTIEYSPYKLKIIPPQDVSISLSGFSDEIIYMIYSYLSPSDILELLCASKELSKFSLNYLYENPVITSPTSLNQYLQQFYRVREAKPLTLPIQIQSLTLTQGFYNEVVRSLRQGSPFLPQLNHQLQELFSLCFQSLHTLSFQFQMDDDQLNNNTNNTNNINGFSAFFLPILQDYVFTNLKTLRLKNPTREILNYLLIRMPHLQYLCQDTYTHPYRVSVQDLFSLDKPCQDHIKNFYYTLGKPIESHFQQFLQSQNLGLWQITLNNNDNTPQDINTKNATLSKFIRAFPNAVSINLTGGGGGRRGGRGRGGEEETEEKLNNSTLMALSSCTELVELQLHHGQFTSIGLCNLFSGFTASFDHLNYLSLEDCQGVNDDVVRVVSEQCSKLTTFRVNQCPWVTDCSMKSVAEHLPELKQLEVAGTRLTAVGLWHLAILSHLRHLNLRQCYNLSLEGLIEFVKTTRSLYFSVGSVRQEARHRQGWIGLEDSLFYEVPEELTYYASNEIEKLKDLQNNYKMYQMQNDISSLDLSPKKKRYQQRSLTNIFLQFSKK